MDSFSAPSPWRGVGSLILAFIWILMSRFSFSQCIVLSETLLVKLVLTQSILKEISPEYSLEGLMLKLKLQYFGHLMWRADSLEKTLMLGGIKGSRKRGQWRMRWSDAITDLIDRVWASSGSWRWTGKPSVLQSRGSQRVRHDWATELKWTETNPWKNSKSYFTKIKISAVQNTLSKESKDKPQTYGKDLWNTHLINTYYPKYIKSLIKFNDKKTNNPINAWAKWLNRLLTKDIQMINKHMKVCSTEYVIRERQTKTVR